ncbi:hypothetical protein A2625_02055 [candidate division WOR-1 bacterium RIFCSPHIGHO2_01_FULL_53_15]|uniref:Ribosomal RNA small subunit methyltransferase E n=1 Tax=candidate division WOR-1 bacterium RIFCSPHIGHO2_01_FULL_53_15 TaxID=1802564 RepID=A0A1F4PYY3_UNCSA|nr:MAG: hypothetical protein A2625_02055 [candidate division WOR-1 bacterium RIFCSPHIGHO2_01_FULL_53_15]OGC10687.1 MAG: hypothetical protein A3D23_00745 [candidate division WOR-1 bacterium RIFCSPHIGHO2_02_FULL_53_26]
MPRFFVPGEQFPAIAGADAHQIRNVLRMKIGDEVELLDGSGKIYSAKIVRIGKDKVETEIVSEKLEESEPRIKITLAQALPKGQKMDFIIEKAVELGASKIIPLTTERTIAKNAKPERWQKLAKEAAEQSGRALIPEVSPLTRFEEVLKMRNQFNLALIPWELEREMTLKSALVHRPSSILVLIGPEGGFSHNEITLAKEGGFISVSLGRSILRAETAGLAVLSAIMYELE